MNGLFTQVQEKLKANETCRDEEECKSPNFLRDGGIIKRLFHLFMPLLLVLKKGGEGMVLLEFVISRIGQEL